MTPSIETPSVASNEVRPALGTYKPKGKIAWLPKPVRDRINQMLLDGLTYAAILTELGDDGKGLNISNLFRYHKNQYRHWLREQHWLAEARFKQESAAEMFRDIDSSSVNQAAVQTTIMQMSEALRGFDVVEIKKMLAADPRSYARIANSLSRLSKENLNLQKYRDACAKAVAVELKRLNPKRELSDAEDGTIMDALDDFLKRPRRKRHDPGNGAPAASPQPPSNGTPPPSTKNAWPQPAASNLASSPPPPLAPVAPKSVKAEPAGNARPPGSNEKRPQATPPALPSLNPNAGPPAIPAPPMLVMPNNAGTAPVQVVKSLAPPVIEAPAPPSACASPSSSPAAACAPEFCPGCQALLPELLPTGQRPFPACWRCGRGLLEPGTELCPGCHCPLPKLTSDGQRPHVDCRLCGTILPPATAAPASPPAPSNGGPQ